MSTPAVTFRNPVLVLHALLAVLVVVGVLRALAADAPLLPLLLTVLLLLGWYALGVSFVSVPLTSVDGGPPGGRSGRWAGWWLAGLVACWLLMVVVSADLVWVALSLWLLAGHLLRLRWAVTLSLLVLGVVIARGGHAEGWTAASIIGPSVGAGFALALSRVLAQVVRDSIERQRLLASLVEAQEETEQLQAELAQTQRTAGVIAERTRLSRDIHDTLAQGFSSILLLARAGRATDEAGAHRRLMGQIETSAAEHLEEARRVVGALAPAPLQSGLAAALQRITARFIDETGVDGQVRVEGDLIAMPPVLEVTLLRTAQAALANVRQHARASRVVVTLAEAEDLVRLDIVDDGVGFDPSAVDQSDGRGDITRGGYGLRASRERLRELGGGLDIESDPGAGTAVSAFLPRATAR